MMNIGTDVVRAFVAVAESLNFTRAGEQLHKTQSAVSQQIKRLESDLGVALFKRNGPKVALTTVGESFLPYARRMIKVHDDAMDTIANPDLFGKVRLGLSDELAMCFFPTIFKQFGHKYPRISVEVLCGGGCDLETWFAKGDLDLYVNTSASIPSGSEIIARTPLVWAASRHHLVHLEKPLPLAMFPTSCSYFACATAALNKTGIDYRVAYSSPSLAGLHAAVASGMAVTVLTPESLPPESKILGPEEGLPLLPQVSIYMMRKEGAKQTVDFFSTLVAEVIREGKEGHPLRVVSVS